MKFRLPPRESETHFTRTWSLLRSQRRSGILFVKLALRRQFSPVMPLRTSRSRSYFPGEISPSLHPLIELCPSRVGLSHVSPALDTSRQSRSHTVEYVLADFRPSFWRVFDGGARRGAIGAVVATLQHPCKIPDAFPFGKRSLNAVQLVTFGRGDRHSPHANRTNRASVYIMTNRRFPTVLPRF